MNSTNTAIGFKGTFNNMGTTHGKSYELGGFYYHDGDISLDDSFSGFHVSDQLYQTFVFYDPITKPLGRFFVVEYDATNCIKSDKYIVTKSIKILEEIVVIEDMKPTETMLKYPNEHIGLYIARHCNSPRFQTTIVKLKQYWKDNCGLEWNPFVLRHSVLGGGLNALKFLVETFNLTSEDIRAWDNWALRKAAENGYLDMLKYLVETFELTADDARSMDNYALQWSAGFGRLDVLKYLVDTFELTADDARTDSNAAVRYATANGYLNTFKYLVELFDFESEDLYVYALGAAANHGSLDILKYLVETVELISDNATDFYKKTLQIAAKYNHRDVTKYITETFGVSLEK